jgi:predicted nucleic acid-binding protein
MKRAFLDATCWVAAAGSPNGGSAQILKLGRLGKLVILATPLVLQEAEENIRDHWGAEGLDRFYQDVADLDLEMIEPTTADEEAQWTALTAAKDLHVLAAAFKASADVLITLDRRHLLTDAVARGFPILVQDTRSFFADWYTKEADDTDSSRPDGG